MRTLRAITISVGDELLSGNTIDSNNAYISRKLATLGIPVVQKIIIGDEEDDIVSNLADAVENADIVTITGGLGPTHDDITKHALCRFFNTELILHENILDEIRARFAKRGIKMAEVNRNQAEYPANATLIHNPVGSAKGMVFDHQDRKILVMPGVPREMTAMLDEQILPLLESQSPEHVQVLDVLTAGIPESTLFERSEYLFTQTDGLKVAFLPRYSGVTIRLSLAGGDDARKILEDLYHQLLEQFPKYVFGRDEDTLSSAVGRMLLKEGLQVATAESCTGGLIASTLTDSSGSSDYFNTGYVTYSNQAKHDLLGVRLETLDAHGAVSEETVAEMLSGLLNATGADYGIAVSGIAGPTGGTAEKPVGTVVIGVTDAERSTIRRYQFTDDRMINKELTVSSALQLLRLRLMKDLPA